MVQKTVTTPVYNFWTTADTLELLRMLEHGTLEYTVAKKLGRPHHAVRKKLARLRTQYNVATTTALVAKCIREGVI